MTTLNYFQLIIKLQNIWLPILNWKTYFYLVYMLVATGATCPDARDVTNSPFIPPESRPAVQSTEEEQGTAVRRKVAYIYISH